MTADLSVLAVAAQGPEAPAFRVRTQVPAPRLRELAIRIESVPLFTAREAASFRVATAATKTTVLFGARRRMRARLLSERARHTAVLIQRQVDMLPMRGLERMAMAGRRVVLDVDDAVWFDTRREAGGHPVAFLKDSRRKVAWLADRSDCVLAGNSVLADWLSVHAGTVHVVPSLVDAHAVPVRKHAASETIVLGWLGSSSTMPYLAALTDVINAAAVAMRPLSCRLQVVGGGVPAGLAIPVDAEPWSPSAEARLLSTIDIGLMPLPDTPWTRGKCAYKALMYMAAGVPVVADDVGVSARVVGDGVGGLIASRRADWIEAVAALGVDAGLRARLGRAGRTRLLRSYSVEAWSPFLAAALTGETPPAPPGNLE